MPRAAPCEPVAPPRAAFPVEFLGWLPAFRRSGDCGTHPQFAHTNAPPEGYAFTRSATAGAPPQRLPLPLRLAVALYLPLAVFVRDCRRFGVLRCVATLIAFLRFALRFTRLTGRPAAALRFAHSRHFQSQVMAPRSRLAFLTSVPYTFGRNPWVIEIEDPTTLFHPFSHNGETWNADLRRSPYFPMVKAMLEADSCRGIVTHVRATAELLPTLFQSYAIARKITHAPLGVVLPQRRPKPDGDTINLLFTNSWHGDPRGFFLRGGLDVLEAFDVLAARYPQLRLTIRSALPQLSERHHRILESNWVRVIARFTPRETLDKLQHESHVFLLPAARIHVVSVLQAMTHGQAVVVSDGWGMGEYVAHGETGLVVPGRYGKVSWADAEAGMLREDYRPMFEPDPTVVEGLVEAVSRLVEERSLRLRLGRQAREAVAERFNLSQWNAALKTAFDMARG